MANKKTVDIGIQYDLGAMKSSFNSMQSQMMRHAKKLKKIGTGMSLALTAPIVAGVTLAVKEFATFEQSMASVQAVTGASAREFSTLSDLAQELGRTTRFTAQEVSGLELAYGKLGFSVDEINQITEATLDLSLATSEDLARSAEVAGSTLRGFNLDGTQMQRVVDVMAKSFTSSALDLEKFYVSISKVAPIAAVTGRSLEEVAAQQSVLADTGVEASIIGTSLRKIYGDLAKSGMTYDEAMKTIQNSTNKVATATELFDIRAAAAAVTLSTQQEKVDRLTLTYQESGGAAKAMGDIMNNTLQMSFIRLRSAVEGLAIEFGKTLSPILRRIADGASELARKLANLSDEKKELIVKIGFVVAAIAPLLIAMGALAAIIATISASPMVLLLGGLTSLGVLLGTLAIDLNGTNQELEKLSRRQLAIKNATDNATERFKSEKATLDDLFDSLRKTNKGSQDRLDLIKQINTTYGTNLKNLQDETAFANQLSEAYNNVVQSLEKKITLEAVEDQLTPLVKRIVEIKELTRGLSERFDLGNPFSEATDGVIEYNNSVDDISPQEAFARSLGNVNEGARDAFLKINQLTAEYVELQNTISELNKLDLNLFSDLNSGLDSGVPPPLDKIKKDIEEFRLSGISYGDEELLKFLGGVPKITNAFDLISKKAKDMADKIKQEVNEINQAFERMIEDAIVGTADMLGRMLTDEAFGGKEFGKGMLEMVANFMQQLGALMITFGVQFALFESSILSANPALAIAAGAAMVAAGAAIKGALSNGLEGQGGYSSIASPMYTSGSNYDYGNFESEVVIQGREMIIVQRREGRFRR